MKILKKPRSYSDFTLAHLRELFGVENTESPLLLAKSPLEPSDWLLTTLEKSKLMSFNSEKAKSELLISPILIELLSRNERRFRCFSGNALDVDAT
jgi:hypothetical protein